MKTEETEGVDGKKVVLKIPETPDDVRKLKKQKPDDRHSLADYPKKRGPER